MKRLIGFILVFDFLFLTQFANAKYEMEGGIGEVAVEKKETWKSSQENFLNLLNNVITAIETNKQLPQLPPQYSDEALMQITSAYLTCSKIQGPCEFILDTLLEIEILKSKSTRKLDCRNIKIFWKNWIDQNFDKQVLYNIKLSQAEKSDNFKKHKMARYVKCEKTIKEITANKDYKTSGKTLLEMKKTYKLLKLLFAKYGDISALYSEKKENKDDNGQLQE